MLHAACVTYGIGGGLFSLLVLSVVASHCAVGSLRLHCTSIRTDQHTGHHTQRAVAWNGVTQTTWTTQNLRRQNQQSILHNFSTYGNVLSLQTLCHWVRLYVSIIVLAGPNEASIRFHCLGHHVIYQTVLVPDAFGLKLGTVFPAHRKADNISTLWSTSGIKACVLQQSVHERAAFHVFAWILKSLLLIDLLEDVFKATVILLQDGVLGAEVQRPAFGQTHLEGAVGKVSDRLVCIVHPHGNTTGAWTDRQTDIHKYNRAVSINVLIAIN